MKTKLLSFFIFISFGLFAQTTHELAWANDGTCANQQITIEVGDTVNWTWGAGTHNLRSTSGTETFDSTYNVTSFSYTFNQVGSTNYVCDPHDTNMYGTVTVTESSSTSETVIAVWDFVAGSTTGVIGDGFSTTGGNNLGWLKNGDQSGVSDPNSVVQSGRGLTGNGFSGTFLQNIDLTEADLIDGKLHISITYNNIDLSGTGTIQQLFLKGSGNSSYGTNHRFAGLKLSPDDNDIKVESLVFNNGLQYGGSKDQGGLGNSAIYSQQITLGTTMDFTNKTSTFWVGSPGENSTNPYGLTMATNDINQSTSWNAATQTLAPNAVLKFLQFCSKNGDGSVEVDQFKISTGTYENTVASGDGEGQEEPTSALSLQGVIDFSTPGTWLKAIHLVASEDIADLSAYGIGVATNGGGTDGEELELTGSATAGDHILVARSGGATATIADVYMNASNTFDQVLIYNNASQGLGHNGDDAIELFFNDAVVETFGEIDVDGTGQAWEYTDSWAYKGADGTWTNAAVNCTDGSFMMWDSGCVYPFVVDQQCTGASTDLVTAFSHDFTAIGPAGYYWNDNEVGIYRVNDPLNPDGADYNGVMQYTDDLSSYSNLQMRFCSKLDLNSVNTVSLRAMIDGTSLTGAQPNQLTLKLQDATEAQPWTNQNPVTQAISVTDQWVNLTFEFNDDASMARVDVDNIVIQFNGEGNNDAVVAYIDDIVFSYTEPVATEYTDVTFNVDTALITGGVGPNGMYLGGGVFGNATAQPMTDTDGDGIWTVTVTLEEGTAGNYIFLNSPNFDADWGAKENLNGQSCADAGNFDDRILSAVGADDYTLNHCFGNCDTDPTTGFCIIPENDYEVTFNVDTNNVIVGDGGMYLGDGIFGGSNAVAMSDDDGDGIWTVTVTLAEGTTGNYAFFKNPGDGGDWGTKENLEGQACADTNNYNNRILDPVTGDTTINYCFATCDASCGTVVRHDVTFNVDTADITVGETGMFIGGGIMGGANAIAMSDTDGDGVYTATVSIPEGLSGHYAFINGAPNHYTYDGKENLEGQACADANNFNDRFLDAVTAPATISYCFATCETSCSTAGLDDLGMSQFTYYPNPVNDQLTVRAQSNVKDITVFNMLGQVVSRQSPNTKDCLVDMAEMQSGAYFVQISIGNTVEMVRVLKK
ncbi:MAG: T9SS type A sorting domain-containing protein [Flavobacteriaceae bacterium]